MNKREDYLNELDANLRSHLPEEVRRKRGDEIRTHLEMDQADREAAGIEPDEAARLARRALGSPKLLARHMVRQARGYDVASPFRLTLLCGFAMSLALTVPLWFLLHLQFQPWPDLALHWLPFLVLISFGFLVVRTQRWLVLPMAMWSGAAVIASAWIGIVAVSSAPRSDPGAFQGLSEAVRSVRSEDALVKSRQTGNPPLDRAPIGADENVERVWLPMTPVDYSRSELSYSLTSARSADEARRLWSANGDRYAADVQSRLSVLSEDLAKADKPASGAAPNWRAVGLTLVAEMVGMAAVFGVANWFLLAVSGFAAQRQNRRDPLST